MFNDDDIDLPFDLEDEASLQQAWQRPLQDIFDDLFAPDELAPPVSIASLYRLSDLPPDYLEQFGRRWPTLSAERRPIIARHLADICEDNFEVDFSPLCPTLFQDPLPAVRVAALDTLWDSSNITLVRPIISLLTHDGDTAVRGRAAETLGHYLLMVEWKQAPQHIKPLIEQTLLEHLNQPDLPLPIWRMALEAFAGSGHGRVPALIEQAYNDPDLPTQISAVLAMGRTADKRWLIPLQDELSHPEPAMRLQAVTALGILGSTDPIEQIAQLAYDDDDLEVRLAAVAALGQIGGNTATETLNSLLEEEEDDLPDSMAEAVRDALEEMMWLGGEMHWEMLNMADEDEDDEDDDEEWAF